MLDEFERWLGSHRPDTDLSEVRWIIETLLELKTEQLDSPKVGYWTEELTAALLTEVVPRKVVQPREDAQRMIPALASFFAFLQERGMWAASSMPPPLASTVLTGLEFAVIEAVDDPGRRSLSGNILAFAAEQGLDLADPQALDAYMNWYNDLPEAQRHELSDTGRLRTAVGDAGPDFPGTPFGPGQIGGSIGAVDRNERLPWPWFLPTSDPFEDGVPTDLDPEQMASLAAKNEAVRRAVILLDLVGEKGLPLTATDALRRPETAEALERMGITRTFRSMWEVPEVSGAWNALHDGRWLVEDGRRVRRGAGPSPFIAFDEDPTGFLDFAHALLTTMLCGCVLRAGNAGGLFGMPGTMAALVVASGPRGLTMPDSAAVMRQETPRDENGRELSFDDISEFFEVRQDLRMLAGFGLLTQTDNRFAGSEATMLSVIAATELMQRMDR